MSKPLTIGLFGYGCVGTGLYQTLNKSALLNARIKRICVKDPNKTRDIDASNFTYNGSDILDDPEINVVVELIDDAEAAYTIVKAALSKGKYVVTANKKMVAYHLKELIELSRKNNVSFLYEGSVCGSIPIIRNLEEYYNNDSLSSVNGICNGTTNYILTNLFRSDRSFDEVLLEAQEKGFAESDPTLDIDGYDAKFKLLILIAHAFGVVVHPDDILTYGIRNIGLNDIRYAKEKGLRIKLFSYAQKIGDKVVGFVAPQMIRDDHFAYNVNDEFNSVAIEALFSDKQLFIGKGAGSYPTGSAVLSDVSALQFNYNYEYRKRNNRNDIAFTNELELRIYAGSSDERVLDELSFRQVDERFSSRDHHYVVGNIALADLLAKDWNKHPDLFFAVIGEPVLTGVEKKVMNEPAEAVLV